MTWRDDACAFIGKLHGEIPADATLKERAAYMRARAWAYHGGTSWGKKIWGQTLRTYLEKHGQKPRKAVAAPNQPQFADDIIFPFRSSPTNQGGAASVASPGKAR